MPSEDLCSYRPPPLLGWARLSVCEPACHFGGGFAEPRGRFDVTCVTMFGAIQDQTHHIYCPPRCHPPLRRRPGCHGCHRHHPQFDIVMVLWCWFQLGGTATERNIKAELHMCQHHRPALEGHLYSTLPFVSSETLLQSQILCKNTCCKTLRQSFFYPRHPKSISAPVECRMLDMTLS